MNQIQSLVNYFLDLKDLAGFSREFYLENNISYARYCKPAQKILILFDYDLERAKILVDKTKEWADDNGLNWELETCFKKYLDFQKEISSIKIEKKEPSYLPEKDPILEQNFWEGKDAELLF